MRNQTNKPLYALKLHFTEPIHIGSPRADYDSSQSFIHSDKFYGAIMHSWAALGGKVSELLEDNQSRFTISSLFPFYQKTENSKPTYFFPKPIKGLTLKKKPANNTNEASDSVNRKKLKGIDYLDQDFFIDLLNNSLPDAWKENIKEQQFLTKETLPKGSFMRSKVYPRVYVPRPGEVDDNGKEVKDTSIYYIERVVFEGASGLFCLIQFDDKETEENVKAALSLLQDEGLGTDRYSGHGLFKWTCDPFTAFDKLQINSPYYLNLSLFCPNSPDQLSKMLEDKCYYDLVKRGGWITTEPNLSIRKKSIHMFREGSIFKLDNETKNVETFADKPIKIAGKMVDLKPCNLPHKKVDHPIYRVGKSFFLPIQLNTETA